MYATWSLIFVASIWLELPIPKQQKTTPPRNWNFSRKARLGSSISKDSKKKRSGNIGVSIRALLGDCLLVTLMGRIKLGHFGYGEVLGWDCKHIYLKTTTLALSPTSWQVEGLCFRIKTNRIRRCFWMYCLYNLPVEPSNFVKQCRLCQGTRSRRYHSWLFASCIERSSSMGARRRYRCSSLVLHDGSRQGTERWLVEDEVALLHCLHSIMSHYGKEAKIMKYHCFSLKSCLACPQIHEPVHQLASTVRLDDSNIDL